MPRTHVVQQGECLSGIALRYGFGSYRALYDHPDNAALKKARPNPNVLKPGDRVLIPDRDPKEIDVPAGATHLFRVKQPRKELRVVLQGHDGKPLAGVAYTLDVDGEIKKGATGGDGLVKERVPASAREATLTVENRVLALTLGHLDPIGDEDERKKDWSGVQARLANLGYDVGPVDGRFGQRTRAALAVFQADRGLPIDGEPSPQTLAELENAHGC